MNRTTYCEPLIETDGNEWTEQSLHSWITEAGRLLKLIDESDAGKDLARIRSQLEGELQNKRQILAAIH